MDTTRLRLDLAYDGTNFSGWAMQPGLRTVQGEIQAAIATLLRADEGNIRLTVAGRTDAGVHARGQVAHLDVTSDQLLKWSGSQRVGESDTRPSDLMARRLNGVIGRSTSEISIHGVREAPVGFDARFGALRRRYEYRLRPANSRRDPLTRRFTADVPRVLDLAVMQEASQLLLGLQDFTTFCKAREGATAVRNLLAFEWQVAEDGAYVARIEADAFCHSMVRALVGSAVAVGHGRMSASELTELRDARERTSRFVVMPANGLSLEEIVYPDDDALALRAAQTRARRDTLGD
ncbi:MAG: tRNA pseudouridine(38-40) synthase TruA [Leucobacter sp.]